MNHYLWHLQHELHLLGIESFLVIHNDIFRDYEEKKGVMIYSVSLEYIILVCDTLENVSMAVRNKCLSLDNVQYVIWVI